jgi:hypothetical protein
MERERELLLKIKTAERESREEVSSLLLHQEKTAIFFIPKKVCVFITAGPMIKLFAGGGGGEWRTCAMRDDKPRPVWMSPLITH